MGFVKELIKFIVNDFKTDYTFLRDVANGKRKIDFSRLKIVGLLDIIKANWLMFILCAAFFCSGYMMTAKDYQEECNDFIVNEVIPKCESFQTSQEIMNGTFDGTFDIGSVHLINITDI